jgi:uncharacterized protein
MHINVSQILGGGIGEHRRFKISGERPDMADIDLAAELNGWVEIMKTADSLSVQGQVSTVVNQACHRCLANFGQPTSVGFQDDFSHFPGDEAGSITHGQIDLAPLIRQELILAQPMKQLCRPDCPGITERKIKIYGRT